MFRSIPYGPCALSDLMHDMKSTGLLSEAEPMTFRQG